MFFIFSFHNLLGVVILKKRIILLYRDKRCLMNELLHRNDIRDDNHDLTFVLSLLNEKEMICEI